MNLDLAGLRERMDIPISFVTDKYLEYLDLMEKLNLDIAGEYLLMAATLAHIKSRELLPQQETVDEEGEEGLDGEEGVDPRQELIRRLLEYQKYKEAAESLGEQPVVGRNVWPRGVKREEAVAGEVDQEAQAPLADIPVSRLLAALEKVLKRAKVNLAHSVNVDRLSVSDRINDLVDRLERETEFSFQSCFGFLADGEPRSLDQVKHEVVVTFLAILEMAKLRMMGFGFNAVTGDFSRGAAGFWIENGELAFPVTEVTISANFDDLMQRIDFVGNDLDRRSSTQVPTLRVSHMAVAGS